MTSYLPDPIRSTDQAQTGAGRTGFGMAFDQALAATTLDSMLRDWDNARAAWLKKRKSQNTRESYETALSQWLMFIGADPWLVDERYRAAYARALEAGVMIHPDDLPEGMEPTPRLFRLEPWMASSHHVNEWIHWMRGIGKSESTIGQRLAACSSFYQYVIADARMGEDGIERTIFFDRTGRTRSNPFKNNNVDRPEITPFGKALPVPLDEVVAMMTTINTETPTGARAFAFLETCIQTGWRSAEVRRLRWCDIQPNPRHRSEYVVSWHGKGGKEQVEAFPRKAYDAIVHYLKAAGRWPVLDPEQHIWLRMQDGHVHGLGLEPMRPYISGSQGNAILRSCLRRGLIKRLGYTSQAAAEEARKYHLHSLRHSHAQRYLELYENDLYGLQLRLHHSNPNTTRIYAESDALKRIAPAKQLDFGY